MTDEFGELLKRDQRSFLHTESLQILQIIAASSLQFTPLHFYRVQFRGLGHVMA